jgi:hypothetical protein
MPEEHHLEAKVLRITLRKKTNNNKNSLTIQFPPDISGGVGVRS